MNIQGFCCTLVNETEFYQCHYGTYEGDFELILNTKFWNKNVPIHHLISIFRRASSNNSNWIFRLVFYFGFTIVFQLIFLYLFFAFIYVSLVLFWFGGRPRFLLVPVFALTAVLSISVQNTYETICTWYSTQSISRGN